MKIKIGIIGFGFAGWSYLQAARELSDDVEVCGIASSSVRKGRPRGQVVDSVGGRHDVFVDDLENCEFCRTPGELLDLEGLDLVIVASATANHAEHVKLALRKKKHVFVESPFVSGNHLKEAERLIVKAQNVERKLFVAQHFQFLEPYSYLTKCMRGKLHGKLDSLWIRRSVRANPLGPKRRAIAACQECAELQDLALVAAALRSPQALITLKGRTGKGDRRYTAIYPDEKGRSKIIHEFESSKSASFFDRLEIRAKFRDAEFALDFRRPEETGGYDRSRTPIEVHSSGSGSDAPEWNWRAFDLDTFQPALKLAVETLGGARKTPSELCPTSALSALRLGKAEALSVRARTQIWLIKDKDCLQFSRIGQLQLPYVKEPPRLTDKRQAPSDDK